MADMTAVGAYIEVTGTYLDSVKTLECSNGHSYYHGLTHKYCTQCGEALVMVESEKVPHPIERLWDLFEDDDNYTMAEHEAMCPDYCDPEHSDHGIVIFDHNTDIQCQSHEITADMIPIAIDEFKNKHKELLEFLETKDNVKYELKYGVIAYTLF